MKIIACVLFAILLARAACLTLPDCSAAVTNCKVCASTTQCAKCRSGYLSVDRKSCDTDCPSDAGVFKDENQQRCTNCNNMPNCIECSANNLCNKCSNSKLLSKDGSSCVDACQVGETDSFIEGRCTPPVEQVDSLMPIMVYVLQLAMDNFFPVDATTSRAHIPKCKCKSASNVGRRVLASYQHQPGLNQAPLSNNIAALFAKSNSHAQQSIEISEKIFFELFMTFDVDQDQVLSLEEFETGITKYGPRKASSIQIAFVVGEFSRGSLDIKNFINMGMILLKILQSSGIQMGGSGPRE